MDKIQECIQDIRKNIGEEKVRIDKATRIAHRIAHGPESILHESLDIFTPPAVVNPSSTEDVVAIIKAANRYEVPLIPQGGRTATYGAEGVNDGIVMTTIGMDRIVKFDEPSLRITVEGGVRVVDYINYLDQRGYLSLELPGMSKSSTMAARVAVSGYNQFENRWGGSRDQVRGLEVVLPTGDVVNVGKGTTIAYTKSAMGLDLMSMFIGSKGTIGVVTKVTERFVPKAPGYIYGIKAFHSIDDALETFMELRSPLESGIIWRVKAYHKWLLSQAVTLDEEFDWPDDAVMLVDYHILGQPSVVETMNEYVEGVCQKHGGFWREDLPPTDFVGKVHANIEKYMGMAALQSERLVNGGMGYRIIPLDPWIPHSNLINFYKENLDFVSKLHEGKIYPNLAKRYLVLSPGAPVPAEEGYTKNWALMLADWKNWDQTTTKEYKTWFREYAELVYRHGGTLTGSHGYVPRDMRTEFVKREMGAAGFELMKTIKRTLDPNNIMNPNHEWR